MPSCVIITFEMWKCPFPPVKPCYPCISTFYTTLETSQFSWALGLLQWFFNIQSFPFMEWIVSPTNSNVEAQTYNVISLEVELFRNDWVIRMEPLGLVPWKQKSLECFFLWHCEKEAGTIASTVDWDGWPLAQPLKLWVVNSCCLSHLIYNIL